MRRSLLTFVSLLLLGCAGLVFPSEPEEDVPAEAPLPLPEGTIRLEPLLQRLYDAHDAPALAAAVVSSNKGLVAIGAVGTRIEGQDRPVTVDDRWHMGSLTKSITATAIAHLVAEGRLSWETPVGEIFPDAHDGWDELSVGQLLQQTCNPPSISQMQPIAWYADEVTSPQETRRAWVLEALLEPPNPGDFTYKNANYLIAGTLAEQVSGRPWETLVRETVYAPLGMTRSGFGPPPGWHQPWGHKELWGRIPMAPGPAADNPPEVGPAGTSHATLPDWARYVRAHLRTARADPDGPWTHPAYAFLTTPRADEDYAGGWTVEDREWADGTVIWHNGSNSMWYALVVMAPEQDRAFLVTTNVYDTDIADATVEALREDPRFQGLSLSDKEK